MTAPVQGTTVPLTTLAKTIRSKNAGPDKITFDVILRDRAAYDLVRRSGVLSREAVRTLYGIPDGRISDHVEFDPALAIKFTILRDRPSGSLGDADIFGSQQYGPLLGIMVPIPPPAEHQLIPEEAVKLTAESPRDVAQEFRAELAGTTPTADVAELLRSLREERLYRGLDG